MRRQCEDLEADEAELNASIKKKKSELERGEKRLKSLQVDTLAVPAILIWPMILRKGGDIRTRHYRLQIGVSARSLSLVFHGSNVPLFPARCVYFVCV